MFQNIGETLMTVAKIGAWIGTAASVIVGLLLVVFPLSLLFIAGGVLVSWSGAFLLYGLGRLIQNSETIKNALLHDRFPAEEAASPEYTHLS